MILFIFVILALEPLGSDSLNIDITSIKMDPDLYRLCWKQFDPVKLESIEGFVRSKNLKKIFKVFNSSSNGEQIHCIENRDIFSLYEITFPLKEDLQEYKLTIKTIFSLSLGIPLPFIRKKVTSTGVLFELNRRLIEVQSASSSKITCKILIIYKIDKQSVIRELEMGFADKYHQLMKIHPGTPFTFYYSCNLDGWKVSSRFMTDSGIVFPQEDTSNLAPILHYPSRRFIYGQWKNPSNTPEYYYITIYKLSDSLREKCVKTFRAYSSGLKLSEASKLSKIESGKCSEKPIEDIGFYDVSGDGNIYVMLDMVDPLDLNRVYKFSIRWISKDKKSMHNFFYFQPIPYERAGVPCQKVEDKVVKIQPIPTNMSSNIFKPAINTNVPSPVDINKENPLFDYYVISSSISAKKPLEMTSTTFEEFQTNSLLLNISSDSTYPFYYAILKQKNCNEIYVIDVAQVFRKEKKVQGQYVINMEPNNADSTFDVSWNVSKEDSNIRPSIYIIRIKMVSNDSCHAEYILGCTTCNRIYKEESTKLLKEQLSKSKCEKSVTYNNLFDALDTHISFKTDKMNEARNYVAEVSWYNPNGPRQHFQSKANFIQARSLKNYYYILISVICSIVGLVALIVIAKYIRMARTQNALSEKEDSNKYYCEDDV